jgi:hypothetical protein
MTHEVAFQDATTSLWDRMAFKNKSEALRFFGLQMALLSSGSLVEVQMTDMQGEVLLRATNK